MSNVEVKGLVSEQLYPLVSEALKNNANFTAALNGIITAGQGAGSQITKADTDRLRFLRDLYEVTQGDGQLFRFVASNVSVTRLSDVAYQYYHLDQLDNAPTVKDEVVKAFRDNLFQNQATSVIRNLVKRLNFPDQEGMQKILGRAVDEGFDMSKTSIIMYLRASPELAQMSEDSRKAIRDVLESLQRLMMLVTDADDMVYLLKGRFTSARSIADTKLEQFVQRMDGQGVSEKTAREIYSQAVRVDRRNERLWADLIQSRRDIPVQAIRTPDTNFDPGAGKTKEKPGEPKGANGEAKAAETPDDTVVNLTTLFNDMDSIECDQFNSVLSPAAYLVDLLQLLNSIYTDAEDKDQGTLLDDLKNRRPDITTLELSRANTLNLIRYTDLAIEIMESYISGENEAQNEQELHAGSQDTVLGYTNWSIYADKIQKQVYPMTTFPYNHSDQVMRTYLSAVGCSFSEFLTLYHSEHALCMAAFGTTGDASLTALGKQLVERASAAQTLGLQPEDFVAITGEALRSFKFYSRQSLAAERPTLETYRKAIGLQSVAEYWGYSSGNSASALDKMLGKVTGTAGINNVRDGLLLRSGLVFDDLLKILDTNFVGKTVVITLQDDKGNYSERLSDMRLLSAPTKDSQSSAILPESVCSQLHVFIRLWRKTGWSVAELDAAICTLAAARLSKGGSVIDGFVDPETILDLAAVKELCSLTSLGIMQLLCLWGDMTLRGPESCFSYLFSRPGYAKKYPKLAIDGQKPQTRAMFVDNWIPMLNVFGCSAADLERFLSLCNLTKESPWTVENLSSVYRLTLACQILDITATEYLQWKAVFGEPTDIFANPRFTLETIKTWRAMLLDHLDPSDIFGMVDTKEDTETVGEKTSSIIVQLTKGLSDVHQKLDPLSQEYPEEEVPFVFSHTRLLELCCSMFDLATAQDVVKLVEGSQVIARAHQLPKFDVPKEVTTKLEVDSANVRLRGILKDSELSLVLKAAGSTKESKEWSTLIRSLQSTALGPLRSVTGYTPVEEANALNYLFNPIVATTGLPDEKTEKEVSVRRQTFMQKLVPVSISALSASLIRTTLGAAFPQLEEAFIWSLLKDIAFSGTNGQDYLKSLVDTRKKAISTTEKFDGYWFPPASDDYVISYVGETKPSIAIDSNPVAFTSSSGELISSLIPLVQDRPYRLVTGENCDLAQTKWKAKAGVPASLSDQIVFRADTVSDIRSIAKKLERVASLITLYKLSLDEMKYLSTQVNLLSLDSKNLQTLSSYFATRAQFPPISASITVLKVYQPLLQGSADQQLDDLVETTSKLAGWEASDIKAYFRAEYPTEDGAVIRDRLLRDNVLDDMRRSLDLAKKCQVPYATFVHWATTFALSNTADAFEVAKMFEGMLHAKFQGFNLSTAVEKLASSRREALTSFLLASPALRDAGVSDANNLFEYFLIDVQMGPQIQTSRIKEAISSVQFFIGRILLGLEKRRGIPTTAIDQSTWAWMSKYSLWQANRQVFLYPENWCDPSLRDDKSEIFKGIEASILQGNLSVDSVNTFMREYIYAANEIADLEIQTYLWESTSGFRGNYHFFARTRTAPYRYYHRIMKVQGASQAAPVYSWYPWTKLEVDIPPHEADADGKPLGVAGSYLIPSLYRGRLFLFIPQITLKTEPKKPSGELTVNSKIDLSASAPDNTWEVKIAWAENRNGVWSKKEVSQAALVVGKLDASNPIPNISSFRFWVRARSAQQLDPSTLKAVVPLTPEEAKKAEEAKKVEEAKKAEEAKNTSGENAANMEKKPEDLPLTSLNRLDDTDNDILVIDVLRTKGESTDTGAQQYPLGRFELRGTQLVLSSVSTFLDGETPGWKAAVPTRFCKLSKDFSVSRTKDIRESMEKYKEYSLSGLKDKQKTEKFTMDARNPMFVMAPASPELDKVADHNLTWTFSFNETQFTGASALVVERRTSSKVQTYFGSPLRNENGTLMDARSYDTHFLKNDLSQALMETATTTAKLAPIYDLLEKIPKAYHVRVFGAFKTTYSELRAPYSIYSWELGFHIVLGVMERLVATQQFQLALDVARVVFDPSANDKKVDEADSTSSKDSKTEAAASETATATTTAQPLSNLANCWKFPPFKSPAVRLEGSAKSTIEKLPQGVKADSISLWLDAPFDAHAIARTRPAVYMRRFVMKYIEILIAQGDEYFRQNSSEAIPFALQKYVEANQLFGPAPVVLPRPTKPVVVNFDQISGQLTQFSTAAVDMELRFPFYSDITERTVIVPNSKKYPGVLGMVRSQYFPVPPNPQMAALRDLIDDRLFKIRNGLDINGNVRKLPLFDPPADPAKLVGGFSASGLASLSVVSDGPMPNYRFQYLLQKAFELCSELKGMGDTYLSIKEKRDTEALNLLRAKQDLATQSIAAEIKQMQKTEAQNALQVLQSTRDSHLMRLKYYLALIGESTEVDMNKPWEDLQQAIDSPQKNDELRMSKEERLEMTKYDEASKINATASGLESVAGILSALPRLTGQVEPFGVGASMQFDTTCIASGMSFAASVLRSDAQQRIDDASRASRKSALIKQLQDRRFQVNSAGRDVKNTDEQIKGQMIRISMADAEIKAQQQQTQNFAQIEEYYKTKYTGEQLYAWMDNAFKKLYYDTYLLTMDVARSAERAFLFERGSKTTAPFLSGNYFDNSRDGAMSAYTLYQSLKRMEAAYINNRAHDYELSKNISLRQVDPLALLQIQQDGKAELNLPEVLFDYDFPGHYCRRIKSVAVSIPCIIGPYTSVSCMLRLLQHRYRLKAKSSNSSGYYPVDHDTDDRFHTDRVPISSVAISDAQNDSGVFNLDFNGERYMPFEGAGLVSRWLLEFPAAVRQFDYSSISDVVLHVKYMALEGGQVWRQAASNAVIAFQKELDKQTNEGGSFTLFDLKSECSNQWPMWAGAATKPTDATNFRSLTMKNFKDRMPFWTKVRTVTVGRLWLALSLPKGATMASQQIKFMGEGMDTSSKKAGDLVILEKGVGAQQAAGLTDLNFVVDDGAAKVDRAWLLVQFFTTEKK